MSWKPIDIAPRDGRRIVVAFRSPMSAEITAFVARWGDAAWEREATSGEVEVSGDTAFAWTDLPEDHAAG